MVKLLDVEKPLALTYISCPSQKNLIFDPVGIVQMKSHWKLAVKAQMMSHSENCRLVEMRNLQMI